jgi:hypothetical protein
MMNTHRTGNAFQSDTASSVPINHWVLSIAGDTCASTLGHMGSI